MKKGFQVGTKAEQRTKADPIPSASVEANPMLSAVLLSVTAGTEADSITTAQNQQVSQPNANTNVVGSLFKSREIKFRAWLIPDDDFESELPYMTYDLAFEDYAPVNEQLKSVSTLMQYTGLKDKNGKEIYEGDIISYFGLKRYVQQSFIDVSPEIDELYLKKQISSVIFHKGCFILKEWEDDEMYMPISEIGLYNIDEIKDMVFGDDRKKVFSEEEMFFDCNGNEINEDKIGIIKIGNIFENPELLETLR